MESQTLSQDLSFREFEGRSTSFFKVLGRPDLTDQDGAERFMESLESSFPRAHVSLQFLFVRDPYRQEASARWQKYPGAHPLSAALQARIDTDRIGLKPVFEVCYLAVTTSTAQDIHRQVVERMEQVFGELIMHPCSYAEFDEELARPCTDVDPMPGKADRAMCFPRLVEAIGPHIPWRMRFSVEINHPAAVKLVRSERRKDWLLRLIGARSRVAPAYQMLLDEHNFTWVVCDLKIETWGDMPLQEQENHVRINGVLSDGSFKRLLDYPVMELGEAISLMPVYRPGSPWTAGDVNFMTRDGKLFPYSQDSHQRFVLTDLIVSKDSADTEAFRLSSDMGLIASAKSLPFIARIQVGACTDPLLNLISKDSAEADGHLVSQFTAVADDSFCVNIFDTSLGYQGAVNDGAEASALLLALFGRKQNKRMTQRLMSSMCSLVSATYEYVSPDHHPKTYTPGVDQEVDDELSRVTLEKPETWWAATEILHLHHSNRVAALAQRHAVPVMADVAMVLRGFMSVREIWNAHNGLEEMSADVMADRIDELVAIWPSLSAPTKLNLGDSRFTTISILSEKSQVSEKVENLTSVLYLLARKAVCGEYFSDPNRFRDGHNAGANSYQRQHAIDLDTILSSGVSRKITYSNVEAVMGCDALNDQLLSDIREARKLAIMISLESSEPYRNSLSRSAGGFITLSPEKISKEDLSKLSMEQIGSLSPWYSEVKGGMNVSIASTLRNHQTMLRQNLVLPSLINRA